MIHANTSPAPELGQHNREILGDLLGMSGDEVGALEDAGVLGPPRTATAQPA